MLDAIAGAIDRVPAYAHCWGAVGRTGTMVGYWLADRGLDGRDRDAGPASGGMRESPPKVTGDSRAGGLPARLAPGPW